MDKCQVDDSEYDKYTEACPTFTLKAVFNSAGVAPRQAAIQENP